MANQFSNATITDQVRQHGEQLAKLTVLVERHDDDINDIKESTSLVATAVDRLVTRDEFRSRFLNIVIPLLASGMGALIGHFWH